MAPRRRLLLRGLCLASRCCALHGLGPSSELWEVLRAQCPEIAGLCARDILHGRPLIAAVELAEDLSRGDALIILQSQQIAEVLEAVATHPDCLQDLATKCEAETRCAQKWYKVAITVLVSANDTAGASALWRRAIALPGGGAEVAAAPGGLLPGKNDRLGGIAWPSWQQVPTIWISGLSSTPFWDCGQWPVVQRLEASGQAILAEIRGVQQRLSPAYPYLRQDGVWQTLFLYRGGTWDSELCKLMPFTCNLLVPEVPTKPGVPTVTRFHEEVVIFRSEPGALVGDHCGATNAAVNLHLTLAGGRGTALFVGDHQYELQDGHAVCFQDSYFHRLQHEADSVSERISLVIRAMHPEFSSLSLAGARRSDTVEDLQKFDSKAEVHQELMRLREKYRELASARSDGYPAAALSSLGNCPSLA